MPLRLSSAIIRSCVSHAPKARFKSPESSDVGQAGDSVPGLFMFRFLGYHAGMSLQGDIKSAITEAMKAREELKLSVLRGISAAIVNELVANKEKPDAELPDDKVLGVIGRLAKQRKESIDQFTKGNREDLADKEKTELEILNTYLPTMLSQEEIEKVAQKKKQELGITDGSGMGQLMGAVMSELKGRADGGDVKAVVEKLLN